MSAIEFRPLKAEDVEVRVGQCSDKGCSLLLYKTARLDASVLDETVGPENWQNDYRSIDGKLFCGIGCRFKDGEWVWKWDTGTPSNMESQKGEASDAFKRAGFKWGIGTELYTAPFIWVNADKCNLREGKNGRKQCYDDFRVTDLEVDDGQIVKLTIVNMNKKGAVVYGSGQSKPHEQQGQYLEAAKQRLWSAIKANAGMTNRKPEEVFKDVEARDDWERNKDNPDWLDAVAMEYEELNRG